MLGDVLMLLHTAYGDRLGRLLRTGERDVAHTEWTAATFHNAKFGARSGATPQDAQERRDAFPFHLSLSTWKIERQTDTRSNYTRTILDNGICANMDRLAPDKARARVAGVIHSVDATRRGSNKRRDQQQRIAVGGRAKADVKH